ncbi:MAG: MgtE-N domain-containing protein [Lachnoclostridium sp.]|jgi:flagellar motility protein MotE (MotC chaperone)
MPRRKKDMENIDNLENEKSTGSKILAAVIVIFIVLIWLAVFGVLIKLDVGGFGSSILRPLIKDVPIVNKILPDVSDEQLAYENDYPYKSLDEAIERIKELEKINDELTKSKTEDTDKIKELQAEVDRLKVFEENQKEFEERVKEFDEEVVFADQAPDIEEYKKYYESIDPTNAEEIYRQVVEQLQYDESIKEKADIYRKMKPEDAAQVLETMSADIDLVSEMLLAMRPTESSQILAEMDPNVAAKITKKMFDMDAEKKAKSSYNNSSSSDKETGETDQ